MQMKSIRRRKQYEEAIEQSQGREQSMKQRGVEETDDSSIETNRRRKHRAEASRGRQGHEDIGANSSEEDEEDEATEVVEP